MPCEEGLESCNWNGSLFPGDIPGSHVWEPGDTISTNKVLKRGLEGAWDSMRLSYFRLEQISYLALVVS